MPRQPQAQRAGHVLPLAYRLFFLFIEPVSALVGAFYTHARQARYLQLVDAASATQPVPRATSVALSQLANMFLFFALNEALVLRSTADMRVWRAVLLVLLIADLGHLYSMKALGWHVYWDAGRWSASELGSVLFVYVGATMRICFLTGVGLAQPQKRKTP